MEDEITRVLVETVVQQAVGRIQQDPERCTRNLVDLALQFSKDTFRQSFFATVQKMLQQQNSPYYALIRNVAANVDGETVLRFGMNVGYEGCVLGAERIRRIETKERFHIPWTVLLQIDCNAQRWGAADYRGLIRQGEELGIRVWQLFPAGEPSVLLELAEEYPSHAFVLYCTAEQLTEAFLAKAKRYHNLMLMIPFGQAMEALCRQLRGHRMAYSVYWRYENADAEYLLSGVPLQRAEESQPVFFVFVPDRSVSEENRRRVCQFVKETREEQRVALIAWDAVGDADLVDRIISGDGRFAAFDADGALLDAQSCTGNKEYDCFRMPLRQVFQMAFPTQEKAAVAGTGERQG